MLDFARKNRISLHVHTKVSFTEELLPLLPLLLLLDLISPSYYYENESALDESVQVVV
jgi:hypothetical protein